MIFRLEDSPLAKFLKDVLFLTTTEEIKYLFFYEYIFKTKDEKREKVTFEEAIETILNGLKQPDRRVLMLRYGLIDSHCHYKTFKEIGMEMGWSGGQRARQIVNRGLRNILRSFQGGELKKFLVATPEDLDRMVYEYKIEKNLSEQLQEENVWLRKQVEVLKKALNGEHSYEYPQERFDTFLSVCPARVRNAILRNNVKSIADLILLLGIGPIRGIGHKSKEYLYHALKIAEQK